MTAALWVSGDAAAATGGKAITDWSVFGISIDTRTLEPGDLFVALAGPNFDGHDFVDAALDAAITGDSSMEAARDESGIPKM